MKSKMYKVLRKQLLSKTIKRIDIEAKALAQKWQPGQYFVVMPDEFSVRTPITSVDVDTIRGVISLVFEENNPTAKKLGAMKIGDQLFALQGPLGLPVEVKKLKGILFLSENMGAANLFPICRAFKQKGSKVLSIAAFDTKNDVILESQLRMNCNRLMIRTVDGSYEKKGTALDTFEEILKKEKFSHVFADGSLDLLKDVSRLTKSKKIKMRVNMASIYNDGSGYFDNTAFPIKGNKSLYVNFDGPTVDAHKLDFIKLHNKLLSFKEYQECQMSSLRKNRPNGSGIFPKLFSGLRKDKP